MAILKTFDLIYQHRPKNLHFSFKNTRFHLYNSIRISKTSCVESDVIFYLYFNEIYLSVYSLQLAALTVF